MYQAFESAETSIAHASPFFLLFPTNFFRCDFLHIFVHIYIEKYKEKLNLARFIRKVRQNPTQWAVCQSLLTICVKKTMLVKYLQIPLSKNRSNHLFVLVKQFS